MLELCSFVSDVYGLFAKLDKSFVIPEDYFLKVKDLPYLQV